MGYVDGVLQPGESVVHRARLHWFIFWRALAALAGALALAVLAAGASGDLQLILRYAALAAVVATVWLGASASIRRASTELAVTDRRVIFKRGVLSRHTIEMNRAKVESVDVDQTLMGRIFGYGTILVHGTGGSLEPLTDIADPLRLRSSITSG